MKGLTREEAFNVCFNGASVVLLTLIAFSAFSSTMMDYMLRNERFTTVIALIFASYDECMRIASRWKRTEASEAAAPGGAMESSSPVPQPLGGE